MNFSETFFRYLAFKNPNFTFANFDFEKDPQRLEWIHNVLDATDPDLSRLQKRGSKLLMYFGWADPALNAQMGVDYYESVTKQMGATTPEFFRRASESGSSDRSCLWHGQSTSPSWSWSDRVAR